MDPADLAAVGATALAAAAVAPQLLRLRRTGDVTGVSVAAVTIGTVTELGWVTYTVVGGLWSAVPESLLMLLSNAALTVAARRAGAPRGRSMPLAVGWLVVLAAVGLAAGPAILGAALAAAYGAQVGPAVWAAYRVRRPTGVATATWVLVAVETALWTTYGVARRDPAIAALGTVGVAGALAIVGRKLATRQRALSPGTVLALDTRMAAGPARGGGCGATRGRWRPAA